MSDDRDKDVAVTPTVENMMVQTPAQRGAMGDLIAFALVGVSGMVAYVALSTGLMALEPPWPRWVSGTLCYLALIVPVYLTHRRFSFRSDVRHRVALPRYAAVQAMAVVLTAALSWLAFSVLGIPSFYGSVLVIGLTSAINFVVLRLWAFASGRE